MSIVSLKAIASKAMTHLSRGERKHAVATVREVLIGGSSAELHRNGAYILNALHREGMHAEHCGQLLAAASRGAPQSFDSSNSNKNNLKSNSKQFSSQQGSTLRIIEFGCSSVGKLVADEERKDPQDESAQRRNRMSVASSMISGVISRCLTFDGDVTRGQTTLPDVWRERRDLRERLFALSLGVGKFSSECGPTIRAEYVGAALVDVASALCARGVDSTPAQQQLCVDADTMRRVVVGHLQCKDHGLREVEVSSDGIRVVDLNHCGAMIGGALAAMHRRCGDASEREIVGACRDSIFGVFRWAEETYSARIDIGTNERMMLSAAAIASFVNHTNQVNDRGLIDQLIKGTTHEWDGKHVTSLIDYLHQRLERQGSLWQRFTSYFKK
jgi:hypothetical protein